MFSQGITCPNIFSLCDISNHHPPNADILKSQKIYSPFCREYSKDDIQAQSLIGKVYHRMKTSTPSRYLTDILNMNMKDYQTELPRIPFS